MWSTLFYRVYGIVTLLLSSFVVLCISAVASSPGPPMLQHWKYGRAWGRGYLCCFLFVCADLEWNFTNCRIPCPNTTVTEAWHGSWKEVGSCRRRPFQLQAPALPLWDDLRPSLSLYCRICRHLRNQVFLLGMIIHHDSFPAIRTPSLNNALTVVPSPPNCRRWYLVLNCWIALAIKIELLV